VGPAALFGTEFTVALGKSTGVQTANLVTLGNRVNYHRMRIIAKALVDCAKTGEFSDMADALSDMDGEELAKGLANDPKAGVALFEKMSMPPFYIAFRTTAEQRQGAAQQLASLTEQISMFAGEISEPAEVEKAGAKFAGQKIVGAKIAEQMGEDRDEMDETLGKETTDQLIAALGKKDLYVVSGTLGDYVVLYIGGSDSHVAAALAAKGCRIIGVDQAPPADPHPFARFLQHDLDQSLPDPGERIDYVLALDVIEHLRTPERLIEEIHLLSSRNREMRLVISTGNVAFGVVRLMLLLGQFNYGVRGILDATHTRLFTFGTLARALRDGAFTVERSVGIPAPFPLALGRGRLANALLWLNAMLIRLSRGMFAYQMLMVCRPVPALDWLLQDAITESAGRARNVATQECRAAD